jgi:LPS sulfotransferase NodH
MDCPDPRTLTGLTPQAVAEIIRREFDPTYYLAANSDVAADGADPVLHYCTHGWREARDPRLDFSTSGYLAACPEVAAADVNPFLHFVLTRCEQAAAALAPFAALGNVLQAPGEHESRLSAAFGNRTRFEGDQPVFKTPLVIVAFTNRSGSNLLASHLSSTGHFDPFTECFHAEAGLAWLSDRPGGHFVDFVADALGHHHAPGRRYAAKASADQLIMLYRWNILRMFPAVFMVHMIRDDLLAQAVSLSIAVQTDRWASFMPGKAIEPRFDAGSIASTIQHYALANAHIQLIAGFADIQRVTVRYEDLVSEPDRCVRTVCEAVGVIFSEHNLPAPPYQRQADDCNDAFIRTFHAELKRRV